MPGHSLEALAAYPELACDLPAPQIFEVHPFWEGALEFSPPLCAGNDRVFEMYGDILSEVIELFPSEFIHVGGDEVPKDSWSKCPRCQARIRDEGLKDVEELQSYFTRRIEKIVAAKGRRLIGWDEILQGGLAQGATVMSWRGTKGGVAAADLGHDVVMTPKCPGGAARLALAHISAAFYGHPSRELVLVGITGTNGKTSTSYLLEAILNNAGRQVGVLGTVNYRALSETWPAPVTTPESLDLQRLLRAMRSRGVSHVVMEVSSHALDLRRVDRTAFDGGLHQPQPGPPRLPPGPGRLLCRQGPSLSGIAGGRQRRPRSGGPQPGRPRVGTARPGAGALPYGCHPESQVRPLSYRFHPQGIEARLASPAGEVMIDSRLVGPFNLADVLAAAATALGLGLSPQEVSRGIAALSGIPGRLERFGPVGGPGIFVDYAHTPDALAQALGALQQLNFSRIITVFGCGGDRDRKKRPLMGAAAALSHLAVLTSDNPPRRRPSGDYPGDRTGFGSRGSGPDKRGGRQ